MKDFSALVIKMQDISAMSGLIRIYQSINLMFLADTRTNIMKVTSCLNYFNIFIRNLISLTMTIAELMYIAMKDLTQCNKF
jgi:hypothetical protein